jgi:hypothetical protein
LCPPASRRLASRLRTSHEFGNAIFRIRFEGQGADPAVTTIDRLGIPYTFTLSSAVEACQEFVVHLPSLVAVAERHGLHLVLLRNFGDYVTEQLEGHAGLLDDLKVGDVSEEEWEAICLYCVMVLRAVPP